MNPITSTLNALAVALLVFLSTGCATSNKAAFDSELFKAGTLVYADDFEGAFNRERWAAPAGTSRSRTAS